MFVSVVLAVDVVVDDRSLSLVLSVLFCFAMFTFTVWLVLQYYLSMLLFGVDFRFVSLFVCVLLIVCLLIGGLLLLLACAFVCADIACCLLLALFLLSVLFAFYWLFSLRAAFHVLS